MSMRVSLNKPKKSSIGGESDLGKTTQKRSPSKRMSHGSLSSRVSARFGFDAESAKHARLSFDTYMTGRVDAGETVMKEEVNLRILKTSVTAAIPRWTKLKANVSLGQGKLMCDVKKTDKKGKVLKSSEMIYDVGLIKNIGYKKKGAKDFTLFFHASDLVLNIVSSSASQTEAWLIALFAEIRVQAATFDILFRELINEEWTKLLRLDQVDYSEDPTMNNLTPEETPKLVMDEETMTLAEACLRESVDLWVLCRGKDHPDSSEAFDRLGRWLKFNMRNQEGSFWAECAERSRENYTLKMKHEMNPAEVTLKNFEDSALEHIRNPPGMKPIDQVGMQREQNDKVDKKKRAEIVLQKMKELKLGGPQKEEDDPFEDLI